MAARQIIVPGAMPSRDANGRALPAKFRFYMPDTTTPAVVYTDAARTIPHEFPLLSDSGGRWPQIWADEAESFSVGWSDQVFDATIKTYSNVQTVKDALLASADIANAAADAAIAAQAESEAIAEKFGDVDAAITAAQAAQVAAETAETNAETAEGAAETAQAGAVAAQAAAELARDEAQAIAGFDPTTYVNTAAPQAFSDPAKLQARTNIGAQPVLGIVDRQKVARPAIVGGVLTLPVNTASIFEVEWDANISSLVTTGWEAGTDSQTITLILIADGGSTFSFGAAYKPVGNIAPELSLVSGDYNFLHFTTRSAGARVDYFSSGFTR